MVFDVEEELKKAKSKLGNGINISILFLKRIFCLKLYKYITTFVVFDVEEVDGILHQIDMEDVLLANAHQFG